MNVSQHTVLCVCYVEGEVNCRSEQREVRRD